MLWDFSEPGEETRWTPDRFNVEPKLLEAAEDLGYNFAGVKRYGNPPSPANPVERDATNYIVFEGNPEEYGAYSGIKAEYTPLRLTLERALEENMAEFLKTRVFIMGSPEKEEIRDQETLMKGIPSRKDYDAELAEELIEMTDAKMDLGVPEPKITDLKEEENEIFRYIYDL